MKGPVSDPRYKMGKPPSPGFPSPRLDRYQALHAISPCISVTDIGRGQRWRVKQLDCRVFRRRLVGVAWMGKPAPPASNNHLRRISPTGFGDCESRGMWSLAACFPWFAGLSRWPLSMREGRGISDQCHDDDDERGAGDSDLFAGARGFGQGPAIDRVCVAHNPAMF